MFVVLKTDVESKKKDRVVVDIQKLNKMILFDFYSLPLQLEIIENVQGCTNLAILDATLFFY